MRFFSTTFLNWLRVAISRWLLGIALGVGSAGAEVPSIEGHLTDPARQLSSRERVRIEYLLEAVQIDASTDMAIVVLAAPVESVPDLARECFKLWKIGANRQGGGLLLMIRHDLSDCFIVVSSSPAPISPESVQKLEALVRDNLLRKQLFSGLLAAVDFVRKARLGTAAEAPLAPVEGNPPVPGIESHVTDPGAALPEVDRISLDRQLANLQADADTDVAIFISPRPVASLVDMGRACFQTWNIGKQWDRGGMLLIVSHDLKDCALILPAQDSPVAPSVASDIEKDLKKKLQDARLTEGLNFALGRIRNLLLKDRPKRSKRNAVPGIESHLTDPARLLSEADRQSLDQALAEIQHQSKVDAVIYIADDPEASIKELGPLCFNGWSVGKSWQGGGLLLAISQNLQDCVVVTTDQGTPVSQSAAQEFERVVRRRLKAGLPLAQTLRYAVFRIQRLVEASGKRPIVYPPFQPNREGARQYGLAVGVILLLGLALEKWRMRKGG